MARSGSPSQPSIGGVRPANFTSLFSGPMLGSRIISQIRPTATDENDHRREDQRAEDRRAAPDAAVEDRGEQRPEADLGDDRAEAR